MQTKILSQRYELEEKIGDGGMAAVYRGRDLRLNRVVAIKILHPHHAADLNFRKRFIHEAQSAANLRHPSIVDIYDEGEEDRQHYIVMEFVDGSDLKSMILRYKQLPVQQVLQIAAAIADGLDAAHQLGMVHRDVKPQNILVTHDGTAKITDFGIAKSSLSTAQTDTGVTFGTADYISPEQARGQPATAQSDIYALGVTIYESLTGQLPFTGDTAVAVALQHVGSKPPPIRRHNPNVSPALEQLVMRALAKNPAERPTTARDFAQLLRAQEESEVRDTAHQPPYRATNSARSATSISSGMRNMPPLRSPTTPLPSREGREFGGFIILLLLLTLVVAVAYLFVVGPFSQVVTPATPEVVATAQPNNDTTVATPTALATILSDNQVPNILNQNEQNALSILREAGLEAVPEPSQYSDTVGVGLIMSQRPAASEPIPDDKTIYYVLSMGRNTPSVPADIIGQNTNQGRQALEALGLRVILIEETNPDVAPDTIVRTDPPAYTQVQSGDTIRVYSSIGNNRRVPNVTGISEQDAVKLLTAAEIPIASSDYQTCDTLGTACDTIQPGYVVNTNPPVGSLIPTSQEIILIVRTP
ncbi:MAG: Stk1 family PASTA domain-containing Ser/Thr kinase [Chloroflexota bacterium]|jgi:serine/threonine-protein kinase